MNIIKKISLTILAVIGIISVVSSGASADTGTNTDVLLTLSGGAVTIGSTGSIDLGTLTISSSEQTKEGSFTDNFWVEDLKGADNGWYTTLQATDMVHQGDNSIKIPAANIKMRTTSTALTKIAGSDNARVVLDSAWTAYRAVNTALTFINRTNTTNNGILGKYGIMPSIQVTIPAYQAIGQYKSILTYTLIEN